MNPLQTIIKTRRLGKDIAGLLGMSYATYRQKINGTKYYAPIPEGELRQAAIDILESDLKALKGNTLIEVLADHKTRGKL